MKFKWLPKVAHLLENKSNITHAAYLESSSFTDFKNIKDFINTINEAPASPDMLWLGFSTHHRPSEFCNGHDKPVVEGSKCIVFRRNGLTRLFKIIYTYIYLDRKPLEPKWLRFFFDTCMIYTCTHIYIYIDI